VTALPPAWRVTAVGTSDKQSNCSHSFALESALFATSDANARHATRRLRDYVRPRGRRHGRGLSRPRPAAQSSGRHQAAFESSSRDVLALQAELASAIAREVNVRLTSSEQLRLTAAPSVNPEAHDAYLMGRYFFNRPSDENLQKAIAQFEEAVRLSPEFARAFSGLPRWTRTSGPGITKAFSPPPSKAQGKAAAQKAVQLDDDSAEAHTSLATFKLP
jgi:hypothetical protein